MSNKEIICTFMEPKPYVAEYPEDENQDYPSAGGWWLQIITGSGDTWVPRKITLNECHLIEARLTAEQWLDYDYLLFTELPAPRDRVEQIKKRTHASAEQKIAALTEVLRPVVEGKA